VTTYTTHLDRLMTALGIPNHELAAKAGTSRQAIYKLRKGITRMLPDWAKRLAPHLGVPWQELVDGAPSADDQARADLLAAYDVMNDEQRRALLVMAKAVVRSDPPEEPVPAPHPKRRATACVGPVPLVRGR
jgi:transcriptional regulator with XRE-family HTH domain